MSSIRRRLMITQEELVWIPLGYGGSTNYNPTTYIDRNQKIYGIAFSTAKSRLASTPTNYQSFFTRIGLAWEPDAVPMYKRYVGGKYTMDSVTVDDSFNHSRIWCDCYEKRLLFRETVGTTNSGWITFANVGMPQETITLEDGSSVNVQAYWLNDGSKLYSYDTSGPCPVYLVHLNSGVDVGYIYILVNKHDTRTKMAWY